LAVHAHGDVSDSLPRVEPSTERPESAVIRGQRAPGEADCRSQKLTALIEHAKDATWADGLPSMSPIGDGSQSVYAAPLSLRAKPREGHAARIAAECMQTAVHAIA